jgi:transcriptional regulator with XRE-family HTH domain
MSSMGTRIKQVRNELHLKQEDFARHFGFSRAFLSAIEQDKCKLSVDNITKLLIDFNVNINFILAGIGDIFIKKEDENEKIKTMLKQMIDEEMKYRGMK